MSINNIVHDLLPATDAGRPLASLMDHTLLKPEASAAQVARLCAEARHYGFAAVCVLPCRLEEAVGHLAGSAVKAGTVVGFPYGAVPTAIKAREAETYAALGAGELDMVLAISALKDGRSDLVRDDIAAVVKAGAGAAVKVILETALLEPMEKTLACRLAAEAGAHFVKTSTGLLAGATAADIRLLRQTVGDRLGVKASGGIRTLADARAMVEAGATRLGTSAAVAIVTSR
jgi:deoxyribose-phosphate aldolase